MSAARVSPSRRVPPRRPDWRRLVLTLLVLHLAGCLIVPVPIPPSGTSAREVEAGLDIGVTERVQVHELFGEPALVIDDRHELFDLAVDPFHFWILMAVGGPGYASGSAGRTGEERTYGLAVVYDEADHVAGWRVLLPRTGVSTGADGRLRPAPPAPIQIEQWRGDQVLEAQDGTLMVLAGTLSRPLQLTLRDGRSGSVQRKVEGNVKGCGLLATSASALTGSWPLVRLVDDQLVSVPPEITADAAPCRWAIDDGGKLVATRIDALVVPDQTLKARLMGDLVLRERPEDGVDILTLAGEQVAHLPMPWPVRAAASDATRGRMLLRMESDEAGEAFWLFDRATAALEPVPEMAPADAAVCSARHIALAPDGELAALRCGAHIEIWRLPLAGAPARLLEVLPLPQDARGPDLAFTPDGGRLVFGARGFVVWRTADWTVEAFLSGDAMEPAATASHVLPIANGSRIATRYGLWRIDGDAAAAQSARRPAD